MENHEYHCLKDLEKRLSDAADEVISCALAHDGEEPFRVLSGDLVATHQFDEAYLPLLIQMLGERTEVWDFEVDGDEFILYKERKPELRLLTQDALEAIHERHYNFLYNLPGGECADLSGMALAGLNMRHMDFSYANFSGAKLRDCDMTQGRYEGCTFHGTCFIDVQAGNTSLELSDFTGAHFEGGNFRYSNFENSNCTGTVFEHVNLHRANLDLCHFYRAKFIGTSLDSASTILAKGLTVNRPGSQAQVALEIIHARHTLWQLGAGDGVQADFTSESMEKLDFSGKDFMSALFRNAELTRCDMSSADLSGCDFSGAMLNGCDFSGANCRDADFTGAELHCCNFTDTELDGADFSKAFAHHCDSLEEIYLDQTMKM